MSTPTNLVYIGDPFGHRAIAAVDPITMSLAVIDADHGEIHAGRSFSASGIRDLSNGEVFDLLLIAPSTVSDMEAHFILSADVESETNIKIYKNTTVSGNGSAVTAYNRRLAITTAPSMAVYTGPSVTGAGTLVEETQVGSGKTIGGSDRGDNELIVSGGQLVMVRITNITTSANMLSWRFNWYEVQVFGG